MFIAAHRGTRIHAPENSLQAMIGAYTAGADVLEFDLQMTADNELVLSHDITVDRLTTDEGRIDKLTLDELRNSAGHFDFSATFNPQDVAGFHYYKPGRRLQLAQFESTLDQLPRDVQFLIELKHDSANSDERRRIFVDKALSALDRRGLVTSSVLYSKDPETLKSLRAASSEIRLAAFDWERSAQEQVDLIKEVGADGLVAALGDILGPDGHISALGEQLATLHKQNMLRVGAVLYPFRSPGIFTNEEYKALADLPWVWSISTDSVLAVTSDTGDSKTPGQMRHKWLWIDETFAGERVNRDRWALGYAKAHHRAEDNAHVYQRDGIHIETSEYTGWQPGDVDGDPLVARVENLEFRLLYAEKSWPYYTGGGVGLRSGISGDFVAEVHYSVAQPMSQAATLEMAVLNVDPGSHRSAPPTTFRDKDSFYDPHGAPPYVGVEHDEDDGYRINWNLGSEYDSNQYGPPVGDGASPQSGTLRLERRGAFFSAYYRNETDAPDWICVGTVKNESLNNMVFLRCVAKRWRQEKADNPAQYWPIPENIFSFGRLRIWRWASD